MSLDAEKMDSNPLDIQEYLRGRRCPNWIPPVNPVLKNNEVSKVINSSQQALEMLDLENLLRLHEEELKTKVPGEHCHNRY